MDIASEWRNRHPRPSGTNWKVIVLILVLALVVLIIVGSDMLSAGCTFLVSPESRGG